MLAVLSPIVGHEYVPQGESPAARPHRPSAGSTGWPTASRKGSPADTFGAPGLRSMASYRHERGRRSRSRGTCLRDSHGGHGDQRRGHRKGPESAASCPRSQDPRGGRSGTSGSGRRLIEVHPEVSFATMVNRPLVQPKSTWAGSEERRATLPGGGDCGASRTRACRTDGGSRRCP